LFCAFAFWYFGARCFDSLVASRDALYSARAGTGVWQSAASGGSGGPAVPSRELLVA